MPSRNAAQKVLPVIATVLIVLGVVAVARFNASRLPEQTKPEGKTSGKAPAGAALTALLFGKTLRIFDDKKSAARECALPDGFGIVDNVTGDGFTVRSATGARMLAGLDCVVKNPKLIPGLANPSGSRAALVAGRRRDGAGVIEISDGKYTEEITLRGKNSRPYRDAEIAGWLDDNVLAVTAFQGDARYALTVQTTGRITELVKLPENAVESRAGDGAFWYVTVTPGEGIELGPRGPSGLHRVATDGTDAVVAKEAGAVIESVLLGPGGSVAYRAGGTLMVLNTEGKLLNIGTGQPLGWSQDGALLVSRNGRLFAITSDGQSLDTGFATAGATTAWQFRPE